MGFDMSSPKPRDMTPLQPKVLTDGAPMSIPVWLPVDLNLAIAAKAWRITISVGAWNIQVLESDNTWERIHQGPDEGPWEQLRPETTWRVEATAEQVTGWQEGTPCSRIWFEELDFPPEPSGDPDKSDSPYARVRWDEE